MEEGHVARSTVSFGEASPKASKVNILGLFLFAVGTYDFYFSFFNYFSFAQVPCR